jgi:hypothetical protein
MYKLYFRFHAFLKTVYMVDSVPVRRVWLYKGAIFSKPEENFTPSGSKITNILRL